MATKTHPKNINVGDLTITFEDLPGSRHANGGTSVIGASLTELRAHPRKWARIGDREWSASVASQIKNGNYVGIQAGEFEARSRKTVDGLPTAGQGRSYVYARYVGKRTRRTANA